MLLVSLNGEQVKFCRACRVVCVKLASQVMANKLLLVLYSPILRELLLSDITAISLPLSTEAIVALLDLLAKGRTFSSKDAHLLEVFNLECFLLT